MAKAAKPVPEGFHTLTPYLVVQGAAEYIDFLKAAFGATELGRSAGPGGRLMHATVKIGDSVLMLADHFSDMGAPPIAQGDWPIRLSLYVPDANATWAQALANGCTVVFPIQDKFWGDRYGQLKDPRGFVWAIAQHIEDLSPQEIDARAKKAFGGGQ